jgi:mono/diheme cytochrome c family protein
MYVALNRPTGDHMRRTTFFLFIAATLARPVPALTQPLVGNNASPGRQVAIEICSFCHQVTEGQPLPRPNAPSFIDIANMPSTTALSLKVLLRSNHKGMPNFIVPDSDADNVIDYILSLKQR